VLSSVHGTAAFCCAEKMNVENLTFVEQGSAKP
jgi:hypothetical protein